jgi:DNA-binding beta-propeller fold protein YncE
MRSAFSALRALGAACLLLAATNGAAFTTFETGQVRPMALSPDQSSLFVVDTPDNRLEIFSIDSGTGALTHTGSVPVGMEPVAVAARTNSEVWVVNNLSDSVSIVDVGATPPRVVRTLLVGDEPRDIVFAGPGGNRAFITTAHRGQNTPLQSSIHTELTTPGIGRADVWVFDATSLGGSLGGTPLTIVTLFGDTPRALAASPDGSTVYAAVFHSGNQTTAVSVGAVCDGGPSAPACALGPGGLPRNTNCSGEAQPEVGLVVKFEQGAWRDRLGRDWSTAVRFSLPDKDVFAIDANAAVPAETSSFNSVGTIIFNMVVDPVNPGRVYVSNTDARNEVQFEGPGSCLGTQKTVRGHLHEARITLLGSGSKVRGKKVIVKDPVPSDASRRRLTLLAKEPGSPNVISANPITGGATVTITLSGTNSSSQTFTLPSGATFWRAIGTIGYKFRDGTAATGLQTLIVKKTQTGVFIVKAIGKGAALSLLPPATGTYAEATVTLGGADTFCTAFGGPAGGTISANTSALFKVLNPSGDGACGPVSARHLNKHIDYDVVPSPAGVKDKSLSLPLQMAITPDGSRLYVAAFGSGKVGVFETSELSGDTFDPGAAGSHIALGADDSDPVTGGGPSGLVLKGNRLYVFTRFDNTVRVVDTTTNTELTAMKQPLHSPEPTSVVQGRRFLYDALETSSNGETQCGSCHVFGDFDSLSWDLGDPDAMNASNPNAIRLNIGGNMFRALKGPMTTQSLRGMANHGPMHWRGDRTSANCSDQDGGTPDPGDPIIRPACEQDAFTAFNVAFGGLLGRNGPIAAGDMQAFTDFILQVTYPPNPIRALDNSLTALSAIPSEQNGHDFYFGIKNPPLNADPESDTLFTCNGCHVLDPMSGFFGTDGFMTFENETQMVKIPHLRNMYQKVGMFGMPSVPFFNAGNNGDQGAQVRGVGFLHDGSVDTLLRFHNATVFNENSGINPGGFPVGAPGDPTRRDVEAFMMAFDSNLAPIVGQQTTLTDTNSGVAGPRVDLFIARAAAVPSECDLIAKGTLAGEQRGWYRLPAGTFQSDKVAEAPITDATLRAQAATAGQDLTYTCVPPGWGLRGGVDRDGDGSFDGDDAAPDDPNVS